MARVGKGKSTDAKNTHINKTKQLQVSCITINVRSKTMLARHVSNLLNAVLKGYMKKMYNTKKV